LLATDDARGVQYLQLVSTRTLRTVQRIGFRAPKGLFVGLTYGSHGRRIYASGGGQNIIHILKVSAKGHMTVGNYINLSNPNNYNPFPIGLATADNDRVLVVAENHHNSVAVIRLATRRVVSQVPVGLMPYDVIASGRTVYSSNWGAGSVSAVELPAGCATHWRCSARVSHTIPVGLHPTAMVLGGGHLYVADSNSDRVSIISTSTNRVVGSIPVGAFLHATGSSPEGLALSPDGSRLYVADSGDNAIVVVRLADGGASGQIVGRIPTAEYPTSVTLGPSGKRLYVTNAFGDGPVANTYQREGSYNQSYGIMSTIPVPDSSTLQRETKEVMADDKVSGTSASMPPPGSPIPRPGGTSPLKHVIYVIKENQTYDNIFGDLKGADGDPRLTRFGAYFTPNLHALARRFGIFDNFYDDGMSSSDGHNWVMSADDDDFNEKLWTEGYSRRNEYGLNPGANPMDLSPGGYIWDRADQAGVSYRDYGEFYQGPTRDTWFMKTAAAASCPGAVTNRYLGLSIPSGHDLCLPASKIQPTVYSLIGHYDPHYRGLDMKYSDADRVREWQREFNGFVQHNDLPQLEIMWLPNDHTAGGTGYLTPESYVAQNDRAVGSLVDAVSHSKYWASTAIFITQDDPQGAEDHVNSQRTECLVISPYTQTHKPVVNSGLYDNASMLRTIELILDLKPMSEFDATADPMWKAFHQTADLAPFKALPLAVPPSVQR
jgi:YVTN family beta-propeller protein